MLMIFPVFPIEFMPIKLWNLMYEIKFILSKLEMLEVLSYAINECSDTYKATSLLLTNSMKPIKILQLSNQPDQMPKLKNLKYYF
jgi:hypothetical protein